MSNLIARLAANLPLVIGILVLLIVAIAAYVLVTLRNARKDRAVAVEPVDDATTAAPAPERATILAHPAGLRRSFAAAVRALRSYGPARDRYGVPWYLVLGESGSGKTTLLENTGLQQPVVFADSEEAKRAGCSWYFFGGGVALDVDGAMLMRADGTHRERDWKTLLGLLVRHRPERAADGIILTIPATDLTGPGRLERDALVRKANVLFQRLREAQRQLGVRVPVYIVLTKCDVVGGFRGFVNELPERLHDEIFGWSSPYSLETAFMPEWVDEAFAGMHADLSRTQIALLAQKQQSVGDSDGVFRFPHELRTLASPLRAMLDEIFRQSAYHESFFFRGIYCTGDRSAQIGEADRPPLDSENPLAAAAAETASRLAPPSAPRMPVFVRQLLQEKIFPERGLARPAARSLVARNRTVFAAQVAIVTLVVGGGLGLWYTHNRLEKQAAPLHAVLTRINEDLRHMQTMREGGPQSVDAEVFGILSSMADIGTSRIWSVFIPRSWFAALHHDIGDNFTEAFRRIILPSLREGLIGRANQLLALPPLDAAPVEGGGVVEATPEYADLMRHLRELGGLTRSLENYNRLSTIGEGDLRSFGSVVAFVHDEALPPDFEEHGSYYARALEQATARPITEAELPNYGMRSVTRAGARVSEIYDRLIVRLDGLGQRFDAVSAATSGAGYDPAEFRGLQDDIAQVRALFASSESFWLDPAAPVGTHIQALLDSIPPSPLLDDEEPFEELFHETFAALKREKLNEFNARLGENAQSVPGPMVAQSETDASRVALAPGLVSLEQALTELFRQGFMQPVPTVATSNAGTNGSVAWSVQPLDEALASFEEFGEFEAATLQGFPPQMQSLVRYAAVQQLENRVQNSVERAITSSYAPAQFGLQGAERTLRERIDNFDPAAQRLLRLLDMQADLGSNQSYQGVADILIAQVNQLLGSLDQLLEQSRLYAPVDERFAWWDGNRSPALGAFGVNSADGLEEYLARQRERVRALAQENAAPLLGYLAAPAVARYASRSPSATVQKWRAMVTALDEYDNKVPGSSLAELEQFVRTDLAAMSAVNCAGQSDEIPRSTSVDYFTQTRLRLWRAAADRCETLAYAQASARYERLRNTFDERIAGRYPFAPPGTRTGDVQPDDLRLLLEQYDALVNARGDVAIARAADGQAQSTFLRRMRDVRAFFSPFVDADSTGALASSFGYAVDFRVNRPREQGGEQIAGWSFTAGRSTHDITHAEADRRGLWQPGMPVQVALRWATEAPRRPVGAADGIGVVSDRTIRFPQTGLWSLVRLLQAQASSAADLGGRGDADTHTLRFAVATAGANATTAADTAQVFVRVRITHPGTGGRLQLPDFPTAVPALRTASAP